LDQIKADKPQKSESTEAFWRSYHGNTKGQGNFYIFSCMYTSKLNIHISYDVYKCFKNNKFQNGYVVIQSKISKNPVFLIIYVKSCCNRYIYSCGLDIDKKGDIYLYSGSFFCPLNVSSYCLITFLGLPTNLTGIFHRRIFYRTKTVKCKNI
jgi:hypothetical protein